MSIKIIPSSIAALFRRRPKVPKEFEYPAEKDGMKYVKFRELIWMDPGRPGSMTYNNPPFFNIPIWCKEHLDKYEVVEGRVMGEDFLEGVYLLEEDIVLFKLIWGAEI
jgi:hypothetical protein